MNVPVPENEVERLRALQEYKILDTDPEIAFERITRLAAHTFKVPIALVSLMDRERQWFKSCYGVDLRETPRELAFCNYTLLGEGVMIIPDMLEDERFVHHPFVAGEPHLRFYAGAPLRTPEGLNLGTVCILDTTPRQFSATESAALTDLAAVVVDELELRLAAHKILGEMAEREQAQRELSMAHEKLETRVIERTVELSLANDTLRDEISERQQIEAALREAEEKYRSLFENAVEGIFQTTPEGHYLSANPALAKMYGYDSPAELIESLTDIEHQLYVEPRRRVEFIRLMQEQGVVRDFESQIRRKDGLRIWVSENARAVHDDGGHILYYAGSVEDITDRKRAEAALRESEVRYQAVVESMGEGLLITDIEDRILYMNSRLAELTGYTPAEANRRFAYQLLLPPEQWDEMYHRNQQRFDGQSDQYEMLLRRKDGTPFWAHIHATPLRNAAGEVIGTLGAVADVSDRKRAEASLQRAHEELESRVAERTAELATTNAELRREMVERQRIEARQTQLMREVEGHRQRLDNTLSNLPGIVWETWFTPEPDGHDHHFVSDYVETMLGYSREEWLSASDFWLEIMHPEDRTVMNRYIAEVGQNESHGTYQFRLKAKDGHTVWAESRVIEHRDAAGQLLGMSGVIMDITERKQAENALRESEERYRLLAENSLDLIGLLDGQGDVLYASPSHRQVLGFEPDELAHQNIFGVIHPDDQAGVIASVQSLLKDGQSQKAELRIQRKQGDWLDVEALLSIVKGESVASSRILLSARDITQRKQAEAALRESEERYARIAANVPGAVYQFVLRADGMAHFPYISDGCRELYGLEPWEIQQDATAIINLVHPKDQGRFESSVAESAMTLTPWHWEGRVVLPSGQTKWLQGASRPERLENGSTLWDGLLIDVTQRKQAEERLRLLESVVVNANDAILITEAEPIDLPGPRILYVNEAFTRTTGYSFEEVCGQTPRLLQGPNTDPAAKAKIRAALEKWQPVVVELLNYHKDGSEFWVELSIVPVADETGWFTHWISVQRDITEAKQAAEGLRLAKEEAERANFAKSEFLSRMSHELRTPLNAILGFTQLLAMDERPPREEENLNYILKAGQHLLELINEVLDITRIETGSLSLSLEPVEVQGSIQEVVDLLRPLAAGRNISIANPVECECYVLADRQRLKQVLLNLVANAVKYNAEGGEVRLSCEVSEGEQVLINVSDTGPGIAPENITRLFTPFDRLGAENTNIEGTGIGLALSKRLVEAMRGKISVSSTVGQGSTFSVELPLAQVPLWPSFRDEATAFESLPTAGAATVLYIEDNLPNLNLVERILEQRSEIRLLTAMQGSLGLELAREHQPNLILLDLHLPDIAGDQVLRRLREDERTREIPVIVLSADATPGRIQRLYQAGAQSYLTKPLQVKKFLSTLEETLSAGKT